MYSKIFTSMNDGMTAVLVQVEADISDGMPSFDMTGTLSQEVREGRERIKTALRNSGYTVPAKRITINLTPADLKKTGNSCDLPIAAAILSALGYVSDRILQDYIILGEVGLKGNILPVNGTLMAAVLADKMQLKGVIVPSDNAGEASVFPQVNVVPVRTLEEFVDLAQQEFDGQFQVDPDVDIWTPRYNVDFAEINGQGMVRRACEIAVAGMHNMIMIGPPGSGKSMIAKRIPTIMPPLTQGEKLELSQIYSLCGLLDQERIIQNERPFRNPHHTITAQSMVGGGINPVPGEVSLAHHGVLFLDELPEFRKHTLEVLREPLEDGVVHISRVNAKYMYPCDVMMVAAMNPCPCGYYPDMNRCTCNSQQIHNYINRISQPLLNRIDISVETTELSFQDMKRKIPNESSADIRSRIENVHELQKERYSGKMYQFNSRIADEDLQEYCHLDPVCETYMEEVYERYRLTARSYCKVLRTARTIADLEQSSDIRLEHLEEAMFYRSPDKKYWGRE